MADDRSEGSRPSWRGKGSPDPKSQPTPKRKASSHLWAARGIHPDAGGRRWVVRRARFFAGLAAFAACLGVVVWLIWMISPPPSAGIVLLGADYATNFAVPNNALGRQGLATIERLSQAPRPWTLFNPGVLQLVRGPKGQTVLETSRDWDELIASLKKGFGSPTLIIMLALHGGSDTHGAYLMPNQMKRPADRLEMRKVIASMKELPAEKTKILVVEGAQITADWRLGMIHNDFARRLAELEPEIRSVPNLWVLSGCDVDQRCWVSEGLGQTIFGYYLNEALQSKVAAGPDNRLSLEELYRYVRENVRQWVWTARGAIQEPVLLPAVGRSGSARDAASGPNRRDPALIHLAGITAPVQSQPARTVDRRVLSDAWLRFYQLDELVPHPSVYSPMKWRAYRAALVRYERLILAGATDSALLVSDQLTGLERSIRKDRRLEHLDSANGINLVMDALNGNGKSPADLAAFGDIAESDDGRNAQRLWNALRDREFSADQGGESIRPLANRFGEYLLQQTQEDLLSGAGQDGMTILAHAADRILLIAMADDPLPAEAHFLRMLRIYLSPPTDNSRQSYWRLVAQALKVRLLAERAALGVPLEPNGYPYCEQLHAWTRPLVEQADARRRTGEDRLFAATDSAWELARNDLDAAEQSYKRALSEAGKIRMALAARDRTLDALPDYSRWLVRRAAVDRDDDLVARVQNLWVKAHHLSGLLEEPGQSITKIETTARELNDEYKKLVAQFLQERPTDQKSRSPKDWETEMDAAAVPFADNARLRLRSAIWDRLDNIREHDQEIARSPGSFGKGPGQPDRERNEVIARRRASLEGRLALAVLGEKWFNDNDFPDLDEGDYRNTEDRLRSLPTQTGDANPWWMVADLQGDRIGLRFRALRAKVAARANEEGGITNFDQFESRLAKADALSRALDRGEDPPSVSKIEPASRHRQARVHDLFVWMADRTRRDHWYSENPNAPPYYEAIGDRLFKSVDGLFPDLHEADQQQRDRLMKRGKLELTGPDQIIVTSELETMARYYVDGPGPGPGEVPFGFPVVRPRLSGPLSLADQSPGYRVASRGLTAGIVFPLKCPPVVVAESRADGFQSLLAGPESRQGSLDVDGFFRGQVFSRRTEVDLQVVPDLIEVGPAHPQASVAVRAGDTIIRRFGAGTGSIGIVLDCSGSMRDDGKWAAAKMALHEVLRESVPPGTKVGIWTFSQLPLGEVKVDETGKIPEHVYTNDQIEPITQLDKQPERTIRKLWSSSDWRPAQADDVQALLDGLTPYFKTPLVEAMWKAANDPMLAETQGLKNLLVLTDGNDNRFAHSQKLNPTGKTSIPEFLREKFRSLGIRVTLVYFHAGTKADPKELDAARNNFEKPLGRLVPPGQFVEATNLNQLIDNLRAGLEQKLVCQIIRADDSPAADPLQFTPADRDLPRWWTAGLGPGFYTLRVVANRPFEQRINLQRSDRLIVDLVDDGIGGIGFRRALDSDLEEFQDAVKPPPAPGTPAPWRVAVLSQLQSSARPKGLRLLTAIESTATAAPILEQVRPGWVDFRLDALGQNGSASVLALRWRAEMAYPGAVWSLDVPRWPDDPAKPKQPAQPELTAWWLGSAAVPHDAEFLLMPLPFDVTLPDGQGVVHVEDFRLETHFVEVKPGERPEPQACLAIRLDYPRDRPCFVDPVTIKDQLLKQNLAITGYEHRYYNRAHKYVGLFWPVNEGLMDRLRRFKFSVVSRERLRTEAERSKQKVTIKLGPPRDQVRIPEAPRIDDQ